MLNALAMCHTTNEPKKKKKRVITSHDQQNTDVDGIVGAVRFGETLIIGHTT